MSADQFIFKKTGDNVYTRKCYGLETLASNMADGCDGFTHLVVTAGVSFEGSPSREIVQSQLRDAWITLRHQAPGLACRWFRHPAPDNHFGFSYTVPQSTADVDAWVKDTFFLTDEVKPLYETHRVLKDEHWWKSSDNHYVAELHASPLEKGWSISIDFAHNTTDGRSSYVVLDLFFEYLTAIIEKKAAPTSQLKWGTEVTRLPPPGAFTSALATTGAPPKLDAPTPPPKEEEKKEDSPPAPAARPWLYSIGHTDGKGDLSHVVEFSQETSSKLHAAAKKHGKTITQVVSGLCVLAHSEAALKMAGKAGEERYKEVVSAFKDATNYLIAWSFVNHCHKFLGGYNSLRGEKGAPLCSSEAVPIMLPIDGVRKLVKLNEAEKSVTRVTDAESFWSGVVQDTANAWKATDTSLAGYEAREAFAQMTVHGFDPHMFDIPSIMVSSIGDLGRLNLLSLYRPSPNNKTPITVDNVICGVRVRVPLIMNLLYQYDDRLLCHWMTGGEYTTPEHLKLVTDTFQELANTLVASV